MRQLRRSGHSGKQFAAYYARLESLEVLDLERVVEGGNQLGRVGFGG